MKLAVFSDVHGNFPALELMLKDAGKVDGYICLGDMVNYGPWADECVDLICSLPNVVIVEGNHEEYFLAGKYGGSSDVAKTFFEFCFPSFSRFDKIKGLPAEYTLNGFTFRHTINQQNIYPDTKIQLDRNYVVGHSHHQFKLDSKPFVLYNPGSVGQNRKYINVINYMLLETDTMEFDFRALTYDEQLIIKELKARKYPALCIEYYDNKERLRK